MTTTGDRAKIRFFAADIFDAPDDGLRYEVIEGELYIAPPPGERHQRGVGMLLVLVGGHVRVHRLGRVYPAPIGVVLDEGNGVEPDLVFVSRARLAIISERGIEGAPDLVVEVLSPRTAANDRGLKLRRYAAAGVPFYWILDPLNRTLEEYRLTDSGYRLVVNLGPGDVFHPALFPGLNIAIDELWS